MYQQNPALKDLSCHFNLLPAVQVWTTGRRCLHLNRILFFAIRSTTGTQPVLQCDVLNCIYFLYFEPRLISGPAAPGVPAASLPSSACVTVHTCVKTACQRLLCVGEVCVCEMCTCPEHVLCVGVCVCLHAPEPVAACCQRTRAANQTRGPA